MCIFACCLPSRPREARRRPPWLHRVGKCSLFRFTDFIRQFRAGCTHHCVGGEPIRTVPPLRVVIDIAGQTPRSAPRRCRLTVLWREHPHTYGPTIHFLVAAVQRLCWPARQEPAAPVVRLAWEQRRGRRRGPARGQGARGCAARHARAVTRGCQAPGDPRRVAGPNTDRPRQCPPRRQRFRENARRCRRRRPLPHRWQAGSSPLRNGWRAAATVRGLGRVLGCPRHGLAADRSCEGGGHPHDYACKDCARSVVAIRLCARSRAVVYLLRRRPYHGAGGAARQQLNGSWQGCRR